MESRFVVAAMTILVAGLVTGCGKPKPQTAYCKRCDATLEVVDGEVVSSVYEGFKPDMRVRRKTCRQKGHVITFVKSESATAPMPDDR